MCDVYATMLYYIIQNSLLPSIRISRNSLEYTYNFQGSIPSNWRKISYPSQSSLSKYLSDLSERIEFFRGWITRGKPDSFWLGGFFFPQSFLTAILQNFARKNGITVDQVTTVFLRNF
jgi:hypothetical protein